MSHLSIDEKTNDVTHLTSNPTCLYADVYSKVEQVVPESMIGETKRLIETLGMTILGDFIQFRPFPDKKTFIGAGKLDEITEFLTQEKTETIVFGQTLTPSQTKNIEDRVGIQVMDRTRLILEIFTRHAKTYEAKLQVKLAYYTYQLPRLKGMWGHLDREGGSGFNKGMGQKQLVVDKFLLTGRIAKLKHALKKIDVRRDVQKKGRRNTRKVSLIGYTNAGKSQLFNILTGVGVLSENVLFSTLDSKSGVALSDHIPPIVLSDTVGFIRRLPLDLVASFKSTLSSLNDSDLLLHVIDAAAEDVTGNINTTLQVLNEIDATEIPVITVFNKIDLIDELTLSKLKADFPNALFISCLADNTKQKVLQCVKSFFGNAGIRRELLIPYERSEFLGDFYRYAMIKALEYTPEGIKVTADIPDINRGKIRCLSESDLS